MESTPNKQHLKLSFPKLPYDEDTKFLSAPVMLFIKLPRSQLFCMHDQLTIALNSEVLANFYFHNIILFNKNVQMKTSAVRKLPILAFPFWSGF